MMHRASRPLDVRRSIPDGRVDRPNLPPHTGYRVLKLLSEDPANYPDAPREVWLIDRLPSESTPSSSFDSQTHRSIHPSVHRSTNAQGIRRVLEQETGIPHPRNKPLDSSRSVLSLLLRPRPIQPPSLICETLPHPHYHTSATQHRRHQDGHDRGDQRAAGAEGGALRAGHHGGVPRPAPHREPEPTAYLRPRGPLSFAVGRRCISVALCSN